MTCFHALGTETAGYNRMRFLHESLRDLDETLKKFGGRLFTFSGNVSDILTHLFKVNTFGGGYFYHRKFVYLYLVITLNMVCDKKEISSELPTTWNYIC